MAPETRSGDRIGEVENRLQTHVVAIEANRSQLEKNTAEMGEMKQMLLRIDSNLQGLHGTINGLMNDISQQRSQDSGGTGGGSSSNPRRTNLQFGTYGSGSSHYSIPTKNTRVEFPKFDGTDFKGWSYRCRQFFTVDGTPCEQRIRLIGIHLEDKALKWHLAFTNNRKEEEVSWEDYMKQMEARFSDLHCTDPMVQIKQLQQGILQLTFNILKI